MQRPLSVTLRLTLNLIGITIDLAFCCRSSGNQKYHLPGNHPQSKIPFTRKSSPIKDTFHPEIIPNQKYHSPGNHPQSKVPFTRKSSPIKNTIYPEINPNQRWLSSLQIYLSPVTNQSHDSPRIYFHSLKPVFTISLNGTFQPVITSPHPSQSLSRLYQLYLACFRSQTPLARAQPSTFNSFSTTEPLGMAVW